VKLVQRTISREVSITGPGLFSGEAATLTFAPAEPDTGIVFLRKNGVKSATINAHVNNLVARPRRTCLKNGTLAVETIEHCMAALTGLGVINALVTVDSPISGELPMGDGSSRPFADALMNAGVADQDASLEPLIISKPVHVEMGSATMAALPGPKDHLEIVYEFEAPQPVGRQVFAFHLDAVNGSGDNFYDQISSARTFVFEHEVAMLKKSGVGAHLSTTDLLVIAPDGPLQNAYRFPDECVRHKVLDLIGDLSLVGRPTYGRIVAHKSGHELNHKLARALIDHHDHNSRTNLLTRDAALDIRRIQRILPHRYPMLLIDRVLKIEGDHRAVGLKNVTFNDVFFQGHYPGTPIFPGVLIMEAMAQLGGILLSQKLEHTGKLAVLLSMDHVKMRHPVVPGDQLILEANAVRVKSRTGHVRCMAFVGDKQAAEADIKFMLVDAEPA
jgi:UDP-3-O-[3-hydroxymyristoyl] N-acetylglucosamine deacetylase / 3-hydroxyacyl-[acyl-carrier-protein] dehydratase